MHRAGIALVLVACASAAPVQRPAPTAAKPEHVETKPFVFIGSIQVKNEIGAELASRLARGEPLKLTLRSSHADPAQWAELARRLTTSRPLGETFTFDSRAYPGSSDPATAAHRTATFVIDFDEPAVVAVHDAILRESHETPAMDRLTRFVDGFIDDKNMQRSFDVASRVAAHKEGDCSEHAVLLAALGRSFGYATRVVLGAVLLAEGDEVGAFGHAWVEYFEPKANAWQVADAAMPADAKPRYVPLSVLVDEGPAFTRRVMDDIGVLALAAIRVERP